MNKKFERVELDIPVDDIDCWNRYPKHRWVYDMSRLLDSQNIKWSPFEREDLPHRELNMELLTNSAVVKQPGFIYVDLPKTKPLLSEIYIIRGEIKHIKHLDVNTEAELSSLSGALDIRLNAFVSIHFAKFTGVLSTQSYGTNIYKCKLRPWSNDTDLTTQKLIVRIYRKQNVSSISNGLSDRVLQEIVAS